MTVGGRLVVGVLTVLLALGAAPVAPQGPAAAASGGPTGDMRTVVVMLGEQVDPGSVTGGTRAIRLRRLVRALHVLADGDQVSLRRLLRTRASEGLVSDVTPLWIVNAISLTATEGVIAEVAARPEVARVVSDDVHLVAAAAPAESNVATVQAPAVWQSGDTGEGVVVATLDSGVDGTHPDLADRWRGGADSWYDPYGEHPTVPTDLSGHGTATLGVILGGDSGGTSIGIAPGATWIAARIFNDRGASTTTAVHQAFQWVLDPDHDATTADAPQVVNGSWSLGAGPGCDLTFQPDVQLLRAAGILPVFAAGNFGPGTGSSVSPANYPESLSVGAVDGTGPVWSASSRGPSACGGRTRSFPDLVAPGVGVVTDDRFGLQQTVSGTSIAAPHAAGALALLLAGAPGLTPDQQWSALTGTAVDLGVPGPDDVYGHGRLDVAAARAWAQDPPDSTGPSTGGLLVSPRVSAASSPVTVGAVADDAATGGSDVVRAEYFLDAAGPEGAGTPIDTVPAVSVSLTAELPSSLLATLADGPHTVWVRAQDAAGNWGPAVSAGFVLDRVAPVLSAPTAGPSPTQGATSVSLAAQVAESGSGLARAEWFAGADPGVGNGSPMTVTGSGPYTAAATVDVTGWAPGPRTLVVRARDEAGTWSQGRSVQVDVTTAPAQLFFSTLGSTKVPGVLGTPDDADVHRWTGSAFTREWDATVAGLPATANVDGYDRVDATHFYLSFAGSTTAVPGLGTVDDEDVVRYDNGTWSLWFDGTFHGLGASNLDLDAISIQNGILYFSTLGSTTVPGVAGTADDADIYSWNGTGYARAWDASLNGLSGAANVDGYVRVSATQFYLSFSPAATSVTGLGSVQDEDVVLRTGAAWSTYYDGTSKGLTTEALDVDAFDVS
ncbi:S8 family serine peptidase [Nocardioides sp. P5_C9_2]